MRANLFLMTNLIFLASCATNIPEVVDNSIDSSNTELESTFLKNDRPKSFNGKVLVCGLKVTPLGGHRLETKWKPNEDKFTDFKIFFGETSSGRTLPVRMNLERWFGTVIIRLIRDVS